MAKIDERRYRNFWIGDNEILRFLSGDLRIVKFPADGELINVGWDYATLSFVLTVRSMEYPSVPSGQMIPLENHVITEECGQLAIRGEVESRLDGSFDCALLGTRDDKPVYSWSRIMRVLLSFTAGWHSALAYYEENIEPMDACGEVMVVYDAY